MNTFKDETEAVGSGSPRPHEIQIVAADTIVKTTSTALPKMTVNELFQAFTNIPGLPHPDNVYVFESPVILSEVFRALSQSHTQAGVHYIRIRILAAISNASLTELELNGGTDGPHIKPLVDAWRQAFQDLPKAHSLVSVQFDMECEGQTIQLREIVRLLQHISTIVWVRGRDAVRCKVIGCDKFRAQWLEESLVTAKGDPE